VAIHAVHGVPHPEAQAWKRLPVWSPVYVEADVHTNSPKIVVIVWRVPAPREYRIGKVLTSGLFPGKSPN